MNIYELIARGALWLRLNWLKEGDSCGETVALDDKEILLSTHVIEKNFFFSYHLVIHDHILTRSAIPSN